MRTVLARRLLVGVCMNICTYVQCTLNIGIFIPVTRRVKGYTRFVGKYVTGRRKRFRPHKEYIFLIRITSRSSHVRLSV